MNTMVQRLRAKFRDDKGVATIYFVIMTVAFLAIVGLVVDGAGKVQANQQAYTTAASAARAAANAVSGQAISDGTTAIVSGDRITVTVDTDYSATFLPVPFPVQATATAELITQ